VAHPAGVKFGGLQYQPISPVQGVPLAPVADLINDTPTGVQTVRDLALHPPYLAILRLLNAVYFPDNQAGFDPEGRNDLFPKSSECPPRGCPKYDLVGGWHPFGRW
jgi:hypothetical protein